MLNETQTAGKSDSSLDFKLLQIANLLEEQKAADPYIHKFDIPNAMAEAFVIVTATSRRHAQGLAESLLAACRNKGFEFLRMEGFDNGLWILMDCNDIIVHIFQKDTRALYRIEDLCRWSAAREKNS